MSWYSESKGPCNRAAVYVTFTLSSLSRLPSSRSVSHAAMSGIRLALRYNWETLKQNPFGEVAGSLGDLGTLLPIMTALTASGAISLTSTLLFSGLANILSGAFFGIPIVVCGIHLSFSGI